MFLLQAASFLLLSHVSGFASLAVLALMLTAWESAEVVGPTLTA
jgi:hypothetical protein